MQNKRPIQMLLCLLIGALLLAAPAAAFAQEVQPPPIWTGDQTLANDDLIVFEPQFVFELPFMEGFKTSFNFGFTFQVPRHLMLVEEDVYNFFVRFRSYIIPGQGEASTP
jgi:hypothetical protein